MAVAQCTIQPFFVDRGVCDDEEWERAYAPTPRVNRPDAPQIKLSAWGTPFSFWFNTSPKLALPAVAIPTPTYRAKARTDDEKAWDYLKRYLADDITRPRSGRRAIWPPPQPPHRAACDHMQRAAEMFTTWLGFATAWCGPEGAS